ERNLEIIGEAVNRIIKVDPEFQIENAKKIIGVRNRIIHGYNSISHELIWSIVINHLPNLYREISNLIDNR
ncbi:MAG: HepT-like ribonuclease domain-containing protein, partial [Bacteroidota bacterium]